jgi:hypothetical protein
VARFTPGDRVLITGPIATKHRDRKATITGVHPSRHSRPGVTSLDKYTVQFDDGEQYQFYDIQLMRMIEAVENTA